jgi:uncharacterized protein YlaI
MDDIPIIFSGPMVRALLDGRKTMTRRLAWRPVKVGMGYDPKTDTAWKTKERKASPWQKVKPGDRLWVRETWQTGASDDGPRIVYRADNDYGDLNRFWDGPNEGAGPSFNYDRCPGATWSTWLPDLRAGREGSWRTPIHMPRWASRLTLVVTATKIEKLQAISLADVKAEGIETWEAENRDKACFHPGASFRALWCDLHGKESWDANPEVVALTFTVHKANIDTLPKQEAA